MVNPNRSPSLAAPGGTHALTIEESARRIGHYRWIEMRVFELLGAWAGTVPEPEVKLLLGRHCYKHAWHAELWRERFPSLPHVDVEKLTAPASADLEAAVAAIAEPDAADQTIERLVGVYRVLIPRKIAAYTCHLASTSAITDGPVIRALQLAIADELDDWREGELLVQSLLTDEADVERAARRHADIESMVVRAGGMAGELGDVSGSS